MNFFSSSLDQTAHVFWEVTGGAAALAALVLYVLFVANLPKKPTRNGGRHG